MSRKIMYEEPKEQQLQIRITNKLKEKLKLVSKNEHRNMSNYVENLIINELNKYDNEGRSLNEGWQKKN